MIVHVRLFATLRRHYPHVGIGEPMDVELEAGATIRELITQLQLPADQVKVVFVNGIVQERGHVLNAGDEVGVFPPVGGG